MALSGVSENGSFSQTTHYCNDAYKHVFTDIRKFLNKIFSTIVEALFKNRRFYYKIINEQCKTPLQRITRYDWLFYQTIPQTVVTVNLKTFLSLKWHLFKMKISK